MRNVLIFAQAATFVALAVILLREEQPKLALAQALLAVVTWAVYSA